MVAVAGLLEPPSIDLAVTIFVVTPSNGLVTLTLNEQDARGASVAPLNVTAIGLVVMVPFPHVPLTELFASTLNPGSQSTKPTFVSVVVVFGFSSVKVSVVMLRTATVGAPNDRVSVGGRAD